MHRRIRASSVWARTVARRPERSTAYTSQFHRGLVRPRRAMPRPTRIRGIRSRASRASDQAPKAGGLGTDLFTMRRWCMALDLGASLRRNPQPGVATVELPIPNHTTLSRRLKKLDKIRFCRLATNRPIPLLIDSTGLRIHISHPGKPPKRRVKDEQSECSFHPDATLS